MGITSMCLDKVCVYSRNRLQVPSTSGLVALIMPSNLPVFLMPNGSASHLEVHGKCYGKDNHARNVARHSARTVERQWGVDPEELSSIGQKSELSLCEKSSELVPRVS